MYTTDSNAQRAPKVKTGSRVLSLDYLVARSSTDDATGEGSKRRIEIDFAELEDGTFVEMIEDPQDPTKSIFAIWNNRHLRFAENLECPKKILVPVPRGSSMIQHVPLATGTEPYESAKVLLQDLMYFLGCTLDLLPEQLVLLSSFILSTWVVDRLRVAPYVAFVGPPGSGKTTALQILRLLCRRSLLTSDISSAAFYGLCDRMTTTVLVDETATVINRRELFHLLRTGTSREIVAVRRGNTFKSFGARAVSWIELPDDAALNSRCILIPMTICSRTNLFAPTDPQVIRNARMLQRKLLQFRLTNYAKMTLPKMSGEAELQPRTRDLFRALATPLSEEKEICEILIALLKQQESLHEVLSVHQSCALELLYYAIHSHPEANAFRIKNLTEEFNTNLQSRGESGHVSERKFSGILTSLRLVDRTRTNSGYVLWLDRKTREQIHLLANRYGTRTRVSTEMSALCELCQIMTERRSGGSTGKPKM